MAITSLADCLHSLYGQGYIPRNFSHIESFNIPNSSVREVLLLFPFYKQGNGGTEKLRRTCSRLNSKQMGYEPG